MATFTNTHIFVFYVQNITFPLLLLGSSKSDLL